MPYVNVNGKQVLHTGIAPIGTAIGTVVLMLHGAYDSHRLWDATRALIGSSLSTVAIDLPGHGASDGPAIESEQDYAHFICELADRLELTKFVICGHSMGGSMAMAYALADPLRVAGLILIGSAPSWDIADRDIDLWDDSPDLAFRENAGVLFSPATSNALKDSYDAQLRSTNPASCKADLKACRSFALNGRLGQISAPVLVLYGSDEQWIEGSKVLVAGLPSSQEEMIEDTGHAIIWEKPIAVADAIVRFVGGLGHSA